VNISIEPATTAPTNLIDYQDLSIWLNDSVRHLRRLVNERRIPYVKVGHFVRFDPDQVRRWLEENANAVAGLPVGATAARRHSPR
jgi:excisionase family DNA binding protein